LTRRKIIEAAVSPERIASLWVLRTSSSIFFFFTFHFATCTHNLSLQDCGKKYLHFPFLLCRYWYSAATHQSMVFTTQELCSGKRTSLSLMQREVPNPAAEFLMARNFFL